MEVSVVAKYERFNINNCHVTIMIVGTSKEEGAGHAMNVTYRLSETGGLLGQINDQIMFDTFMSNTPSINTLLCAMILGYHRSIKCLAEEEVEREQLDMLKNLSTYLEAPGNS